jgi:hypothetical protein
MLRSMQAQYLVEDAPVQRLEEMLGPQLDRDILDDAVVDHQRAKKGGLRLDIARQALFFAIG